MNKERQMTGLPRACAEIADIEARLERGFYGVEQATISLAATGAEPGALVQISGAKAELVAEAQDSAYTTGCSVTFGQTAGWYAINCSNDNCPRLAEDS